MKRKSSKNNPTPFREEKFNLIQAMTDHKKMVMPAVLIVCVLITIAVALQAGRTRAQITEEVAGPVAASESSTYTIPDSELELNAYPEVNELIDTYYTAFAEGDMDTIDSISSGMSETRRLRLQETAKFIESVPKADVYTKPGPNEGSYIVYVYEELKFRDYADPVPGMESMLVSTDENGRCYLDFANDEAIADYIREVSLQDDVVDLNNKIAARYNEMVAGDDELSVFLSDFAARLNEAVGVALASSEAATNAAAAASTEEDVAAEGGTTDAGSGESAVPSETNPVRIRATDVIRIRKSDSETADILGRTTVGQEFEALDVQGNGWTKIKYENDVAFVKSVYFENVEPETSAETENAETGNAGANEEPAQTPQTEEQPAANTSLKNGDGFVADTVRIRKSASTDAEILTTAYQGNSIEIVSVQADGWSKVKYQGISGYAKSEFLKN